MLILAIREASFHTRDTSAAIAIRPRADRWFATIADNREIKTRWARRPPRRGSGSEQRRHDPDQRRRPHRRAAGHVQEPPAEEVPRRRPAAGAQRRRLGHLEVPRHGHPERRAERGRRPPQGGVRARAAGPRRDPAGLLQRRRAHQGHERRRHPGLDLLPVVSRASPVGCSPPTTTTSRSRWCRPTTTGTSTSGAAPTRPASSRWRSR